MKIAALLLVALLSIGCEGRGKELKAENCQLFVKKPATEAEGQQLLDYLTESGFCESEGTKSVQLKKEDDVFQFRMVVKEDKQDDKDVHKLLRQLAAEIQEEAFDGEDLVLHVCNDSFKTLKSLKPKKQKKKKEKKKGGGTTSVVIPNSPVALEAPDTWKRKKVKDWGLMRSPDGKAMLAFVAYSRPNESTTRIGQVATVLGATDIKWGKTTNGTIGRDKFPARVSQGSCTFGGTPGKMQYATVDTGETDKVLVVYAVEDGADESTNNETSAIIKTLHKK